MNKEQTDRRLASNCLVYKITAEFGDWGGYFFMLINMIAISNNTTTNVYSFISITP